MSFHTSAAFDGPVELVKAIFDTAARQEKSTALKLLRVCRAARQWVIPILYETVDLVDNPSTMGFETMLTMSSSPSPASSVRNLRITCLPDVDLLSSRCCAVETLTLWNHDIHHLERLRLPALTHLTIGGSLRYTRIASSMTAFSTVTHLRFANDVPYLPDDFMTAVPHLTHFSCCYRLSKKTQHRELEQCLGTVLSSPALRVAVVYVHTRDPKAEDSITHTLGIHDPRVVVASSIELPHETLDLSPTYNSSWMFAEDKLEAKSLSIRH